MTYKGVGRRFQRVLGMGLFLNSHVIMLTYALLQPKYPLLRALLKGAGGAPSPKPSSKQAQASLALASSRMSSRVAEEHPHRTVSGAGLIIEFRAVWSLGQIERFCRICSGVDVFFGDFGWVSAGRLNPKILSP